jgi:nesprin-1
MRIEDLYSDLRDGTKLIALLEILSGERLPVEKSRNMKRPHFLSNANTALQFLTSKKIKLVNINSADLVDGKPAVVLGLIWTIILYFQIEENSRILNCMTPDSISMELPTKQEGPKKSLLSWVSKAIPSNLGIEVKDFGPSWRDGYAFMGLINAIDENLIDIENYRNASNKSRLHTSFNVAETNLGIPKLIEPDDLDIPKPDEKSVMTYVAQFLHKYPEPKSMKAGGSDNLQTIQNIIQWMHEQINKYENINGQWPLDVEMYQQSVAMNAQKYNQFDTIKTNVKVPEQLSMEFNNSKQILKQFMDDWKKFIDYNLPGELKSIGVWLNQAEKLLEDTELPIAMNEEVATMISKKIEHHKKFFAAYPDVVEKFNAIKSNPQYQNISPKIMEFVERRLIEVEPKARQRRIKLKFAEHKCCLIAFLNLLENKIASVRYGNEDVVKFSLEQIRNFLTRNKIVEEFEKALVDMRQVIEEYKIDGNLNRKDLFDIDTFMNETENRWKSVSTGLKCTETMLEETLNHWKNYNNTTRSLSSWMDAAEVALGYPEMERLEFFQDVAGVKRNYDSTADFYNFLKATCDRETVSALDHDYNAFCQRFERIYQYAKQYTHAGDILKNRQMYENGIQQLCRWLRQAEAILSRQNITTSDQIKEHQEHLKHLSGELEEMEDLFRNISKSFQTLIPDISRDEVDRIMKLLKKEKECLVCVRAQIPVKMQLFHQLLSQQESIEKGQQEITQWLDEAENLLSTYSLATRKSQTLAQLEKHKQFFSKTLYYKSMLESKNAVLQNLLRAAEIDKNIDTSVAQEKMANINERFNYVVSNAVQWERKLQEIIANWSSYEVNEKQLSEYLKKANHWLTQPINDNSEDLDAQVLFFENINDSLMKKTVESANELSKTLPNKQEVVERVDKLQQNWNNLIAIVPLHLMKIHFFHETLKFTHLVRDIEKELSFEEQAFHRNENLDELLSQHIHFFQQSPVMKTAELSLSNMHNILTHYNAELPNDKELNFTYQNKLIVWQNLCKRVDNILNDLQQIPDQWKTYRMKFTQIENWMDSVDVCLANLTRELNSLEEFEKEKLAFQVSLFKFFNNS